MWFFLGAMTHAKCYMDSQWLNYGGALIVVSSTFHLESSKQCSEVEHLFCNRLLLNNVGRFEPKQSSGR